MTMIDFRILGPLEVETEDGLLALGGQKQRALLGLLLMRVGEVIATDRLVDQLWGEQPPRTATTSLQNHVSQLRKLLGADVIVTRPPGYVLQIDAESLDLARFQRLVAEARSAEAAERAEMLGQALGLWRGPPLADLAFETFAQGEIRRLEELRLAAVEERIDAQLELGESSALVPELEALVAALPSRERPRAQLMLALYRSGRQTEALDVYHDARKALADELGLDPGPKLQQLYASILRQESVLTPTKSESPLADHFTEIAEAMLTGKVVAVVGAEANHVVNGQRSIPGLDEIAAYLADAFGSPPEHRDLARVSEYVELMRGVGPLYDELHDLLNRDFEPGPVHHALADMARLMAERGGPSPLVVTTNLDLALEHAFAARGVETDVVSYIARGRHHGRFLHVSGDAHPTVVDLPNAYTGIPLEERAVVLRLLGQVDRQPDRRWESFAVTEDDHIDYLAQADISSLIPVTLVAKLRRSHFLFIGYPLRDWGLRVFLHRIWGRETVAYRSWAVEAEVTPVERELWRRRGVDVFDMPLEEYVMRLAERLAEAAR
jgi:DNA-binding SARP family transcriptional activator